MLSGNLGTLGRFKKDTMQGQEHLCWYWVVGPHGAVSTWFSRDAQRVLGHSVCDGVAWHSPIPLPDVERHQPCPFLETECWWERGSMLYLDLAQDAFDVGDDEAIYWWLEKNYADRWLAEVT